MEGSGGHSHYGYSPQLYSFLTDSYRTLLPAPVKLNREDCNCNYLIPSLPEDISIPRHRTLPLAIEMLGANLKPTASIFPVELFDEIFSHYADENLKTFSTWALVCKAFVHPSRSRLFSYVSLISPSFPSRKFERFLHLLDSPLCTIAPHVKRLHVMDDDSHWVLGALPCLSCLTGVQSLELEAWDWAVLGTNGQETFLEIFGHIRHLKLEDVIFPSFAHLTDALYSLPDLVSLFIVRMTCSSSPPPRAAPLLHAPLASLRELRLHGSWPKQRVFNWLLSHDAGPFSVRSVEILDINSNHTASLGRYLRRLGPELTEFSFRFSPFSDITELSDQGIPAFLRDVNLMHNVHLTHLNVRLLRPRTFGALLQVLSQSASGNLRVASVRMRIFRAVDLDPPDWPALDALLDGPQFAQMEELRIELRVRQLIFADMRALVLGRLPRCSARGILSVVEVDGPIQLVRVEGS